MNIKYEIQTIDNASGTGEKRQFIRLHFNKTMSLDELASEIQNASTVTSGDVKVVLSELRRFIIQELSMGGRFYLPEIGYLSLAVGNVPPSKKPNGKITGNDIFLKNINFKPEASLLDAVNKNVGFEKSSYTRTSAQYTEEELRSKLTGYLSENRYITRRLMRMAFHLSGYMASKWLDHFMESGLLVKSGSPHQPLYFLSEQAGQ